MKKNLFRLFLISAIICLGVSSSEAQNGRLTITPTRLVIDARERSGEVTIMNVYSGTATYRVQLLNYKMKTDGTYETLDAPLDAAYDPAQFVRVTPRQFRLEPRGLQRIRLSVRRPADLPPGDYRFHIIATRIADTDPNQELPKGVSASIQTNIGITIPVVVRQGAYNGDVKIEDVQFQQPAKEGLKPRALVTLRRIGNNDIFGGVKIFWEPATGGERQQIGLLNNINVFHDVEARTTSVPIDTIPQGGKLIVQYEELFYKQGIIDEYSRDI